MPAGRAILTRPLFPPAQKSMCRQLSQRKRQRFVKGTAEEEEKNKEKKRGYAVDSQETAWFTVAKRCERKKKKGAPHASALRKNCMSPLEKERAIFFLSNKSFCRGREEKKSTRHTSYTTHTRPAYADLAVAHWISPSGISRWHADVRIHGMHTGGWPVDATQRCNTHMRRCARGRRLHNCRP